MKKAYSVPVSVVDDAIEPIATATIPVITTLKLNLRNISPTMMVTTRIRIFNHMISVNENASR